MHKNTLRSFDIIHQKKFVSQVWGRAPPPLGTPLVVNKAFHLSELFEVGSDVIDGRRRTEPANKHLFRLRYQLYNIIIKTARTSISANAD